MDSIYNLLVEYRYLILLPLAAVEGPAVTILAGFVSSTGLLQVLPCYFIIIGGNLLGDTFYYLLGRFSNKPFAHKPIAWLGLNGKRLEKIHSFMGANLFKTIALSKIILGVGILGLFLAGKAKISYSRYLFICFSTSLFQCAAYLCMGWFFGKAYMEMDKNRTYVVMLVMLVAGGLIFVRVRLKTRNTS